MQELLQPVELLRIVEDDARDGRTVHAVRADRFGSEALGDLAPNLRVFP